MGQNAQTSGGPLSHLRVIEIGSSVAGGYCGKMFADFGAEVIKIEPPGGDPLRRGLAPLLDGADGPVSGTFAWLNTNNLTMGWAGPMATRLLADLGADIIKVEACNYPDWWRGFERSERWLNERFYEKNPFFNSMNMNKRGITLDLRDPEGVEVLRDLIKGANLIIENYSADVMPKLGLDYDQLRQINPSLVMVSMPLFAAKGLWSECRGYGTTLEQASVLPSLTGQENWPPTMSQYAYADPYGGFNAAAASLLALLHQRRTGEGQYVEMAHVGGMLALAAPGVIEQSATGQAPRRIGNRHPLFTPHGAFRCAGGNRWVVIAVTNDVQWRALCGEMGRADLAAIADRRSEEAAIEEAISGWTREQTPDEVMTALQAAGVPAGKVQNSVDILHDAHLASRGFWQHLERAYAGETTFASAPFREDAQPYRGRTPAPTLGEHNEIIFAGELKLSPEKLRALAARSVIGSQVVVEQKQKPVAAKEGVQ